MTIIVTFSGDISLKKVAPGLDLMESKLEWILTGRVNSEHGQTATSVSMLTYTASPISATLDTQFNDHEPANEEKLELGDFWNLETLEIREPVNVNDDDKALQKFNETIRFEDRCYQVNLALERRISIIAN